MTKAAYIPTSFVGDTIVNLAVCRAIIKETGITRMVYPMLPEIHKLSHNMVKDDDYNWLEIYVSKELTDALADPQPLFTEKFDKGKMKASYPLVLDYAYEYRNRVIQEFANHLSLRGVRVVYMATFTFGALKLAQICESQFGIEVIGHVMRWDDICLKDEIGRINREDSGIHHEGFIGDKWSNWFAGRKLCTSDFYIREPEVKEEDYILVMPSSRSKNQTAGHWDLDVQYLLHTGHRVKVGIWAGDLTPELYTSFVNLWAEGIRPDIIVLEDFTDTLRLVKGAKLVITNDSGQFHAAWIMKKKCIVKTKDFFVDKWIPEGELHRGSIVAIQPIRLHSSDYLDMLKEAIEWSLQA